MIDKLNELLNRLLAAQEEQVSSEIQGWNWSEHNALLSMDVIRTEIVSMFERLQHANENIKGQARNWKQLAKFWANQQAPSGQYALLRANRLYLAEAESLRAEVERLREERDRLAEWVARLETDLGEANVRVVRLNRALLQIARAFGENLND